MSQKFLSEDEYQKNNAKVKKIGKILLTVGIIMIIISFVLLVMGFVGASSVVGGDLIRPSNIFKSFGTFAAGGFMLTISFGVCGTGGVLMLIAHRREIMAYTTRQVMPVAKEGLEEMAPTMGLVGKEIAKGIKEGISEANTKK